MKNEKHIQLISLVVLMSFMVACTNKYEALCNDLDKITDPAQKVRLSKECNLPMQNTAEPTSNKLTPISPVVDKLVANYSHPSPGKKRHSTIKKSQEILWGPGGMHP